jgi:hypothetical protein
MSRDSRGGSLFLRNVISTAVGAYTAETSKTWGGLAWRLVAIVLIILAVPVAFAWFRKEKFIPTPSAEQDKKYTTPAGNVITY